LFFTRGRLPLFFTRGRLPLFFTRGRLPLFFTRGRLLLFFTRGRLPWNKRVVCINERKRKPTSFWHVFSRSPGFQALIGVDSG